MSKNPLELKKPKLRFKGFVGGWKESTLEELSDRVGDGIHTTPKYSVFGDYFFINGNNLVNGIIQINDSTKKVDYSEYLKNKRDLDLNTILISINGTIGNVSIYNNEKVVLGKSSCYIRLNKVANRMFVFNLLQNNKIQNHFISELTGSTIKNLSLKSIKNTKLYIPEGKEEQSKIGEFLNSIDKWIENLKGQKESLESYKKGMMQKLFSQEVRFKDDRGKEFPKWEEKKLGDFKDLITGDGDWILTSDITAGERYKVVQLGNIGLGEYIEKNLKTISEKSFLSLNGTLINKGDLLINRMVDNSICCCVFPKDGDYITSVDVCWIRENIYFNNYFFMSLMLIEENQNRLLSISAGSGRVRISRKNLFNEFQFKLPSIAEQDKIADFLTSIDKVIESKQQQIIQAELWKKGLMQGLFV